MNLHMYAVVCTHLLLMWSFYAAAINDGDCYGKPIGHCHYDSLASEPLYGCLCNGANLGVEFGEEDTLVAVFCTQGCNDNAPCPNSTIGKPTCSPVLTGGGMCMLTCKTTKLLSLDKCPVAVSVYTKIPEFQPYEGGVLDSDNCFGKPNHAMLLAGYGTDEKLGKDCWILKNWWGIECGEGGYMRLVRKKDEKPKGPCSMYVLNPTRPTLPNPLKATACLT
ncbi:hypothetical protein FOL47_008688 [Perkinsus chesapeaki]|uniref:Peptidase C1A papain C-terminal domain-containing protein n=1 Tax=Perkinsus chesapeaki TaxID=330153 RepID=A0A7J6MUC3_PERCH|nr:hypothetical protein FOL47_008688 [Perkinsus chesapeaki]